MSPAYHPVSLSGGDRKALAKELGKARAMANILAAQSVEMRAKGEAIIQQADKLLCEAGKSGCGATAIVGSPNLSKARESAVASIKAGADQHAANPADHPGSSEGWRDLVAGRGRGSQRPGYLDRTRRDLARHVSQKCLG
jgi:hypothetical protein